MPVTDLSLLIDAARAGSEIAVKHWKADPTVWTKDGGSPVSEADLAVDTFLKDRLRAARPDYGWLSEETEDGPARLGAERVFIVDPIDGTRAYIDGQKAWALSLAVVENGVPTAGVVYLPMLDRLYAAARDKGATLNRAPIEASGRVKPDGATVLAPTRSMDPKWWPGGLPGLERHFRPSLAYRFCLVAEGRFDGMLSLSDAWEWDIAAGALIAEEAGATVTDRNGDVIRMNAERPKAPGVLTAPPVLHADLIARLI